jgi:hypothetical protein
MQGIGTIGHSIGTLIEFIVIPGIRPLMREYGQISSLFNKKARNLAGLSFKLTFLKEVLLCQSTFGK